MGNILSFLMPLILGFFWEYKNESYIEQIQILNNALEYEANHNFLTGLYNRKKFINLSNSILELSIRYEHPLTFCIFDIDDFKNINDSEGHLEGDRVLKEISKIIKLQLRKTDIIARFGGDEFCIMFPETELEDAINVIEKIRLKISTIKTNYDKIITCSFGLSFAIGKKIINIDNLLNLADQALYSAKRNGKNRIEYNKSF